MGQNISGFVVVVSSVLFVHLTQISRLQITYKLRRYLHFQSIMYSIV